MKTMGAALICWHHLFSWPAVRDMVAELRRRGNARYADLLVEAASRTRLADQLAGDAQWRSLRVAVPDSRS